MPPQQHEYQQGEDLQISDLGNTSYLFDPIGTIYDTKTHFMDDVNRRAATQGFRMYVGEGRALKDPNGETSGRVELACYKFRAKDATGKRTRVGGCRFMMKAIQIWDEEVEPELRKWKLAGGFFTHSHELGEAIVPIKKTRKGRPSKEASTKRARSPEASPRPAKQARLDPLPDNLFDPTATLPPLEPSELTWPASSPTFDPAFLQALDFSTNQPDPNPLDPHLSGHSTPFSNHSSEHSFPLDPALAALPLPPSPRSALASFLASIPSPPPTQQAPSYNSTDPFDHSASQSPFDSHSPFPTDPFSLSEPFPTSLSEPFSTSLVDPLPPKLPNPDLQLSVAKFLGREHEVLEQYGAAFVEAGCGDLASLLRLPEVEMRAFIEEDLLKGRPFHRRLLMATIGEFQRGGGGERGWGGMVGEGEGGREL